VKTVLSVKTTGSLITLGIEAFLADPILATIVGGGFIAGGEIYDIMNLTWDKTQQFLNDFENSIGKTWVPGQ
jgi:hypothetical protein